MAKLPPEYEPLIAQIIAEQQKVSKQKLPPAIVKEMYKQLQAMVSAQSGTDFDPSVLSYVAFNMTKVFSRILGLAKSYPPTKRHGVGDDGGVKQVSGEDWVWLFSGMEGGDPNGGDDGGDDGDFPTGPLDWAPPGEIQRARDTLDAVAKELDFGFGDDPLAFVREVARRLGGRWGLNGKRGNAGDPSKDVLAWDIPGALPQIFDVLGDAGGDNKIQWLPLRYGQASVWIAP
jgi:hypothetical protein